VPSSITTQNQQHPKLARARAEMDLVQILPQAYSRGETQNPPKTTHPTSSSTSLPNPWTHHHTKYTKMGYTQLNHR